MGQMVSFKRPDGKSVNGYLAEPASGSKAPGIVVIQEWWGLNEQIKGVAAPIVSPSAMCCTPSDRNLS